MSKLRIASAVAALTSALAFPVFGADTEAVTKDRAANLDQPVPATATQQPAPATNDNPTTGAQQDSKGTQAKARKHPPTAAMDSATPTDKSTTGKSASTKHPPTAQMDSAAPDQKSPDSTSSDAASSGTGTPASATRK